MANKPFYVLLQGFAERSEYNSPFTLNREIVPVFIKQAINYKGQSYDILGISTKNKNPRIFGLLQTPMKMLSHRIMYFLLVRGLNSTFPVITWIVLEKKERIDNMVSEFLRKNCINDEKLPN